MVKIYSRAIAAQVLWRDHVGMYRVTPAQPSELRKILRVTLAGPRQSPVAIEEQVTGFIEYARAMGLDLSRHWWCHFGSDAATACTCVESAGHSAMLFVPFGGVQAGHESALGILLGLVLKQEQERGIKLIQCLLHPEDQLSCKLLAQQQFRQIAELIYMERTTHSNATLPHVGKHEWIFYGPSRRQLFSETIELTYDGSMDCRGLSGLRDMEDIMAAHKSAGIFVPERWLILMLGGAAAGCILLAENHLDHHAEVAYMGVCPKFRGRKLGEVLMRKALEVTYHAGLAKLTLAVDAANTPARKIYDSLNFTETTRRSAWVRSLVSNPI